MQNIEQIKDGATLIAEERARQIYSEGWTESRDMQHSDGELACAAACYVIPRKGRPRSAPALWPFEPQDYKPSPDGTQDGPDRIRELVKAGALIAAEIDRLSKLDRLGRMT